MITSTQNAKLKLVRSLMGRPKERLGAQAFLVEGVRLVEEALNAGWPMRYVMYAEGLNEHGRELIKKTQAQHIDVEQVSEPLLRLHLRNRESTGNPGCSKALLSSPFPHIPISS